MSPILFFRWFLRYLFIHSVSQPYVYSCILLVIYSFILSLVSLVTLSYFVCVRENCERDATLVLTKPRKVAEECRNRRKKQNYAKLLKYKGNKNVKRCTMGRITKMFERLYIYITF